MSDDKTDACLRLEFFKAAILQPAFEREREPTNWDNADTIISAFGAIEAAHWASLGTRIGYFDGKEVRSAILSESLVKAWLDMRNRQLISSGDVWGSVLEQRSGNLVLNEQLFPLHVQSDEFTTEILHEAFQTFLLLTGESIVDRESLYFLSSIGWTDDRVWEARKDGMVREHKGSAHDIGYGFSNVWHYWEEIGHWALSPRGRRGNVFPVPYLGALRTEGATVVAGNVASSGALAAFIGDTRAILSRRFNLEEASVVDRYFVLAGEFVNRAKDGSPDWLDGRFAVFERLAQLITYAGGGANLRPRREQLWEMFAKGSGGALPSREVEPLSSPWTVASEESS
jgi:hypothetical protein